MKALVESGEVREVLLPFLWRNIRALRHEDYGRVVKMLTDSGVLVANDAAASQGKRTWVMPMRLPVERPNEVERHWSGEVPDSTAELQMQCELYDGVVPPGAPERSVAGCQALGQPIQTWRAGALVVASKDVKVLLEVLTGNAARGESAWLRVKVRGKELNHLLWATMERFVQSCVLGVLSEYPGLLFSKQVVCPGCLARREAEPTTWDADQLLSQEGECEEYCRPCGKTVVLRPPKPAPLRKSSTKALLEKMIEKIHKVDTVAKDVVDIKLDLSKALTMLSAQSTMLATLLQAADNLAPRLILFVPAAALESNKLHPKDLFTLRVRVFFVDPIRYEVAPTNPDEQGKGQGFELDFPKEWVAKAMPYVKLGLTALKVAHVAGKLAGIPIPDVGGWIDSQLSALGELKQEAIDQLSGMTNDAALATELLGEVDAQCQQVLEDKLSEAAAVAGAEPLAHKLKEPLEKSLKELDALLAAKHPDWKDKCGLVKTVAADADGATEWVLEKDVEEFKRRGRKMMQDEPAKGGKAPDAPTRGKSTSKVAPDDVSAGNTQAAPATQQSTTSSNSSCCSML